MNLKPLLHDFDFKILEDPYFKEDSVREDILMPILSFLGFRSDGNPKIIRSKPLLHPYIMLGSQRKKVNIIPDYLIYDGDQVRIVIDAKAPNENIESGDNVCQVYSYAIHPEIRSFFYALCNGRALTIFSIFKTTPLKTFCLPNLTDNDRLELFQKLRMINLKHYDAMNFNLDFGLFLRLNGFAEDMKFLFMATNMYSIAKLSDDLFTFSFATENFTDRKLLVSIDFSGEQYNYLLALLPPEQARSIKTALSQQPYHISYEDNPPIITAITEGFGPVTTASNGEEFIPLKLVEFKKP